MKTYKEIKEMALRTKDSFIEVTLQEFEIILSMPEFHALDRSPRPPVKRSARSTGRGQSVGFLSYGYNNFDHEEIEYDYHAPEYLKALDKWEQEKNKEPKYSLYNKEIRVRWT